MYGARFGGKIVRVVARAFAQSVSLVHPLPATAPVKAVPRFVTASSGFPKDLLFGCSTVNRRDGFGDDACFVAQHETADVVGVADGVGGWRDYGVDPSKFSRSLMKTCAMLVREGKFSPQQPVRLLASGYSELAAASRETRQPLLGSSTACIVILDNSNSQIHTANLGDSGFLVLREGKIVHRSEFQHHYFNTPFQLSLPPPNAQDSGAVQFLRDSPESAESTTFDVQEGDLILVATDGLFDNMPPHLIESEISKLKSTDQESIQAVCNSIALQARRLAFDKKYNSPFAQKAKEHGFDAEGGKPDDITVILAVVSCAEVLEPSEALDELACESGAAENAVNLRR